MIKYLGAVVLSFLIIGCGKNESLKLDTKKTPRETQQTIMQEEHTLEDKQKAVEEIVQIAKKSRELKDLEVKKVKVGNEKLLLLNTSKYIYFGSNQHKVKSKRQLGKILNLLQGIEKVKLTLIGHTDSKGNDVYNQLLSELRAKEVYEIFRKNGISKNQLDYIGYGEEQPLVSNKTSKGRATNRRVEILLSDTFENAKFFIEKREINTAFLNNHKEVGSGKVVIAKKGQTKNKSDVELKEIKKGLLTPKREVLNINIQRRKHIVELKK